MQTFAKESVEIVFFLIEMIIYFYIVKGAFLRLPVRPVGTGGCAVLL